jgi:hypothetical protein
VTSRSCGLHGITSQKRTLYKGNVKKQQDLKTVRLFKTINYVPLGRPRRRWVDNIKMDLREIGWDGVDWIELAQDRDQWRAFVNTVMNLRVP